MTQVKEINWQNKEEGGVQRKQKEMKERKSGNKRGHK